MLRPYGRSPILCTKWLAAFLSPTVARIGTHRGDLGAVAAPRPVTGSVLLAARRQMATDGSLMLEKASIGYRAQGHVPSYHYHSLEYDNV